MFRRQILFAAVLLIAAPAFAQAPRVQAALDYIAQEAPSLGLSANDVSDLVVTDAYVSRRSGITHVYVRQGIGGIEVIGSEMTLALGADGRVFHTAGNMLSGLDRLVTAQQPVLDARNAVHQAASYLGVQSVPTMRVIESDDDAARKTTFAENAVFANRVRARLVYKKDAAGDYRLAWELEIAPRGQHMWLIYVDAMDGSEVARIDLTVEDNFGFATRGSTGALVSVAPVDTPVRSLAPTALVGSYTVYPAPIESPIHAPVTPPADGRSLIANPDDATASPFGWHDTNGAAGAEFTITRGNNTHAYLDRDDDEAPDVGGEPDGGAGLVFTFELRLNRDPVNYTDASVTNLFY